MIIQENSREFWRAVMSTQIPDLIMKVIVFGVLFLILCTLEIPSWSESFSMLPRFCKSLTMDVTPPMHIIVHCSIPQGNRWHFFSNLRDHFVFVYYYPILSNFVNHYLQSEYAGTSMKKYANVGGKKNKRQSLNVTDTVQRHSMTVINGQKFASSVTGSKKNF